MLFKFFVLYRWEIYLIKEVYIFIFFMLKYEFLNNERGKRWLNIGYE